MLLDNAILLIHSLSAVSERDYRFWSNYWKQSAELR